MDFVTVCCNIFLLWYCSIVIDQGWTNKESMGSSVIACLLFSRMLYAFVQKQKGNGLKIIYLVAGVTHKGEEKVGHALNYLRRDSLIFNSSL